VKVISQHNYVSGFSVHVSRLEVLLTAIPQT
jgi:hypothetical protein